MNMNYKRVISQALRMYFAPLTGAYKGVLNEYARLEREVARTRIREREQRQDKRQH